MLPTRAMPYLNTVEQHERSQTLRVGTKENVCLVLEIYGTVWTCTVTIETIHVFESYPGELGYWTLRVVIDVHDAPVDM